MNLTINNQSTDGGATSYTSTYHRSKSDFTFNAGNFTYLIGLQFEAGILAALRGILEGNVTFFDDAVPSPKMLQSGLNAASDITATMDRVAVAMTNTLRDFSNLTVQGQSGSMELYIQISWPWLALPVLSVILETILLISVITVTRKHRLPIWKTSELALLFHGLDFSLDDRVKRHKVSEMEEAATALRVRLGRGPSGDLQLQRKLD